VLQLRREKTSQSPHGLHGNKNPSRKARHPAPRERLYANHGQRRQEKIDGEKTRVTLKASVIGNAADESRLEKGKREGSFAERLTMGGNDEEPTQRFEAEEAGPRWAERRYREVSAAEALKWQRVTAVMRPETAMTCIAL
jgi:hypothetical protein